MLQDKRCKASVIGRTCLADPIHEDLKIVIELGESRIRKRRRWRASVMSPDASAQEFAPDGGATAFIRNLVAPAADIMALTAGAAIATGARADDQDGSVASLEGAEPGGMGIGLDLEGCKRMGARQKAFDRAGLPGAGGSHAGMNPLEVAFVKPCLGKSLAAGRQNRIPYQIGIEAEVGRTARSFTQQRTLSIAQPSPALGAAAVNAKEQKVGHMKTDLGTVLPTGTMPLNVQFGKRRRHGITSRFVHSPDELHGVRAQRLGKEEPANCG